ncbi:MAG: acyltransferase [Candidatus Bathyarchaeia archaeon]|jgi:maltose O-acetyltransferase
MNINSLREVFAKYHFAKLRKRGLNIGKNVFIDYHVVFDAIFPYLITISDDCTISVGTVILAHDASTKRHLQYSKVGKVYIGRKTFIGANCVILPNVNIGKNVIVGAGSVVSHDLPDGVVAVGCPAKIIGSTENYVTKHKEQLETRLTNKYKKDDVLEATSKYGLIYTA